jgi:hypothetical protein
MFLPVVLHIDTYLRKELFLDLLILCLPSRYTYTQLRTFVFRISYRVTFFSWKIHSIGVSSQDSVVYVPRLPSLYTFYWDFKMWFQQQVVGLSHYNHKLLIKLGVVAHAYNPNAREAEAGGSWVWDQPRLQRKTLSQINSRNLIL